MTMSVKARCNKPGPPQLYLALSCLSFLLCTLGTCCQINNTGKSFLYGLDQSHNVYSIYYMSGSSMKQTKQV